MSPGTKAFDAAVEYAKRLGWQIIETRRPRFVGIEPDGNRVAVRVAVQKGTNGPTPMFGSRERNSYRQEGVARFDGIVVMILGPDRALLRHERDVHPIH